MNSIVEARTMRQEGSMQTIRTRMPDGSIRWLKPKGYKPMVKFQNTWHFISPRGKSTAEAIYEIGMAYYNSMKNPKGRPSRHVPYVAALTKLFFLYFMTGARSMEFFRKPSPTIEYMQVQGKTYMKIIKVNEKHFKSKAEGIRDITIQLLPIFNEWESRMWDFVFDGMTSGNFSQLMQLDRWPKKIYPSLLNKYMKNNFKGDLKDPSGKVHKRCGINPHLLRHLRSFNLIVEENVPEAQILLYFGWKGRAMLDHYSDVAAGMTEKNQLDMLTKAGLLTSIPIGSLKEIMTD